MIMTQYLRLLTLSASLLVCSLTYGTGDWCATPIKTSDGFLNLRSGPGVNFQILGQVHNGDVLLIDTGQCRDDFGTLQCDESGRWVFVQSVDGLKESSSNQKGWVSSRYITSVLCNDNASLEHTQKSSEQESVKFQKTLNTSDLAAFAESNQITGNEIGVYTYEDEACGTGVLNLVDTFPISNNRVGIITFDGACWGATYTYFEMNKNSIESISPFAQVSAGRSTHFSNWEPASNDMVNTNFNSEQLLSIARAALIHNISK